jgi:hypothetical protein
MGCLSPTPPPVAEHPQTRGHPLARPWPGASPPALPGRRSAPGSAGGWRLSQRRWPAWADGTRACRPPCRSIRRRRQLPPSGPYHLGSAALWQAPASLHDQAAPEPAAGCPRWGRPTYCRMVRCQGYRNVHRCATAGAGQADRPSLWWIVHGSDRQHRPWLAPQVVPGGSGIGCAAPAVHQKPPARRSMRTLARGSTSRPAGGPVVPP